MANETIIKKIWRIIYPVLTHIVIYILVLFGADILFSATGCTGTGESSALEEYAGLITSVAMIITIPVLYSFYKRDYVEKNNAFLKSFRAIILIVILGIAASHGLSLFISLFSQGNAAESYQNIEEVIFSNSPVLVIIRTIILAPVCEELIFRGLMFRRLKEYTGFAAGALISSAVFAIYHLNLLQGIFAFILGMILCLVYDRMKNLFASIFLHAAGNLISIILYFTAFEYPSTAIYVAVMVVLLLISAAICYMIIKRPYT